MSIIYVSLWAGHCHWNWPLVHQIPVAVTWSILWQSEVLFLMNDIKFLKLYVIYDRDKDLYSVKSIRLSL